MNSNYEVAQLFALDYLGACTSEAFRNWALKSLESGATETSIAILAGLSSESTYFEAKEYFNLAVGELGIEEPEDSGKIDGYIEIAAREIANSERDYHEFLDFAREAHLKSNGVSSKYDLTVFFLLFWAVHDLEAGEPSWSYYYEDLDVSSKENSIVIECKVFLGILPPEASPIHKKKMERISRRNSNSVDQSKDRVASNSVFKNIFNWFRK
jgi:hypothetical protein